MTSPKIQKDIVSACAQETVKAIIDDLDGDYFGILADESKDISHHEQMAFALRDQLRDHQAELLEQLLESVEVQSGKGLNQKRGLQRPGDTRWGSHCKTLDNFVILFSSIVHVLGVIECEGDVNDRLQAEAFSSKIKAFEFVFLLHLMLKVLIMSNELSKALQKKDQDIVNAMVFLDITKERLQEMRDKGWEPLMNEVYLFCAKHDILVPKMEEFYIPGKLKRRPSSVTYSHHLRVELFYAVIDLQLLELNSRFDVVSSNLLLGMAILNPGNSFANFDKERIMTLAKHYPDEFGELKLRDLSRQLDTFIWHMQHGDPRFSDLKLTLILPVATATVERAFSSMKYIKDELRSSIGDAFLNYYLVCYFEKEVFVNISNDAIIDRFQNMKTRRVQL
ncbi:PREDICTED: uncharacterized protein LOC109231593 [Nicotiana attenuata]|uniref:uncharacterized protein LOC109231593 n=1 Tax=Nicotiana attenuata TaxID=49451 RepID=UPI0009048EC8|nr:PREDICTED: uncharacterized protein LOC109231593 [Nicotiana attenuata]